jgi:dienelactone hydrolase
MSSIRMIVFAFSISVLSACAHEAAAGPSTQTPTPNASSAAKAAAKEPMTSAIVETKEVSYQVGVTSMKGFVAYPANARGKRPGVLVVHEWWGLNDYARLRAKKLAELGYVAMALDMYGEGKQASHPEDAQKFMAAVMSDAPEAARRFEAARALLASDAHVDSGKIAAIGYCFGGAVVLNMARAGSHLDVVASFHGMLSTQQPMKPGVFAGRIFVAQGGADPFVPPEQVEAFRKEMDAAGAGYEVVVYPGAKHSFTNPGSTEVGKKFGLPLEYNADADAASWQKLEAVLALAWPAR